MPQVTLDLPDELTEFLAASGRNLERAALEAIALEAYREQKISTGQLRRLLGHRTRAEVHAFLKTHDVYLHYDSSDLEHDRQAANLLKPPISE
jgi:predicted HTH domain antitoxin